jgi:pimeloyl-ACP methyl ester carboxylesterase
MRTETPARAILVESGSSGGGTLRPVAAALAICGFVCLTAGCCTIGNPRLDTRALVSPERLDRGYTLLLPGITGCTSTDHELIVGFARADVPSAIEMYDWTEGPWLLLSNLRGLARNRRQARKIAGKIVAYQDRYPGRPVHVIGYSGGAGMAVLALEALPPGRRVTSAILLGATLAPDYDLRLAMGHTERGIRSFYSPLDVPILMGAIALVGTTEGRHTVGAGAWGFTVPKKLRGEEREQYQGRLAQQRYTLEMLACGNFGGHYGWIRPRFVQQWLVPLVSPPSAAGTQTGSRQRNQPY